VTEEAQHVRMAAITPTLDWAHREKTSGDKFDLDVARAYVEDHVRHCLLLVEQAAERGARLVLGPEYFRGSEMFMTTEANKAEFVEAADGQTVQQMREASRRHGIYLAAAMDMRHGDAFVQTGVVTGPGGELVGVQMKNTALPEGSPLAHAYELFDLSVGKTGIFTCSDLTTYPEDTIPLATAGMQIVLVPGCGFAGEHWKSYLTVRAMDLACVVVHADGARGAIVDADGAVLAEGHDADAVVVADVVIEPRQPTDRLRSGLGRKPQS